MHCLSEFFLTVSVWKWNTYSMNAERAFDYMIMIVASSWRSYCLHSLSQHLNFLLMGLLEQKFWNFFFIQGLTWWDFLPLYAPLDVIVTVLCNFEQFSCSFAGFKFQMTLVHWHIRCVKIDGRAVWIFVKSSFIFDVVSNTSWITFLIVVNWLKFQPLWLPKATCK